MMPEKKERNRKIMELYRNTSMSYREIAGRFGISTSAVYEIVQRMLKKEQAERADALDPDGGPDA